VHVIVTDRQTDGRKCCSHSRLCIVYSAVESSNVMIGLISDVGRWSTNYRTLSRMIRDSERLSLRLSIIYNTQCTCSLV